MTLSAVSSGRQEASQLGILETNLLTISGHPKVHMSTLAVLSSIDEHAGLRGIKTRNLNGFRIRVVFGDMGKSKVVDV